jgi:hypothetical protein
MEGPNQNFVVVMHIIRRCVLFLLHRWFLNRIFVAFFSQLSDRRLFLPRMQYVLLGTIGR